VRRRLQEAALALYSQHGYDATTAAEIAAEAGVTERTFFRHFPDKREVLFNGEEAFRAALAHAVAAVPEATAPLAVLRQAFPAVLPILQMNQPFAAPRFAIIAATPALRERQQAKIASFQQAATEALRARGIPDRQATLAAQVGMAALAQAIRDWIRDPTADFDALLTVAFRDLRELGL